MQRCPLCKKVASIKMFQQKCLIVDCVQCGKYSIGCSQAVECMNSSDYFPTLAKWIKKENKAGKQPSVNTDVSDFQKIESEMI